VRTFTALAAGALAVVALAACGSTDTPSSGSGGTSPPGPAATSAAAPPKASLPTNGQCVLIPTEKAATLLGSTPTSTSVEVEGEDGIVKIDSCTHAGAGSSVSYAVNDYAKAPLTPAMIVDQATAAMSRQSGPVKFDVPVGDKALGFTAAVGGQTMARIEIAKGTLTIGVNAVAPDAATAKQIALGASQLLVAAVG
jgi:hypothetical protein